MKLQSDINYYTKPLSGYKYTVCVPKNEGITSQILATPMDYIILGTYQLKPREIFYQNCT